MIKKILIVDDDQGIRDSLKLLLEDEGYTIFLCPNAKDVSHYVEEKHPDIILLDVFLKGHDGRKICFQLKNKKGTKDIPIIILSGHKLTKSAITSYRADDYLQKPYDVHTLLKLIKKYLKPRRSLLEILSKPTRMDYTM
ncbi:MAG TPA: response regulator [Candidatus Saccharimonadales bacterium]|nr:response regulator [Candidatus Saccharimonadales bacterium]